MTYKQYLLVKLAEEAAEVAQMASKSAHFGMHQKWVSDGPTNAERTHGELDDLLAIVELLNEEDFGYVPSMRAKGLKRRKVKRYLNESIGLGEVAPR